MRLLPPRHPPQQTSFSESNVKSIAKHAVTAPLRLLAEQAFSRAAGAPLVGGNSVRVLKDADENYPAWLAAITAAQHTTFTTAE